VSNSNLVPPGLTYLTDNIISRDNILGAAKTSGAAWSKNLNLPKGGETVFFAGCGYQYAGEIESIMSLVRRIDESAISTEMAMKAANVPKKFGVDAAGMLRRVMGKGDGADGQPLQDAVRVLHRLGLTFGYLAEDEPCCGGLLHYAGLKEDFRRQAESVRDRLKAAGVRQIVGIVPSCTYTLRTLIPQILDAGDVQVKHFCEIVAGSLSSLDLCFPRQVKVTYHDPCQLVRYLGLVDEPRRILKAIKNIEFIETEWTNREWATCCGGGGGFEAVFPEMSQMLAVNRVKELTATGAEIIVTHCPGCILQLKAGLRKLKMDNVAVLDLAQVVSQALE
jgi:dimethylglycine catabolism B